MNRRDILAMSANSSEVERFRERVPVSDPVLAKRGFFKYQYTSEEARYRFADAMIVASQKNFIEPDNTRLPEMGD